MKHETSRERMEQLLRLAQAYRGWTRKQLAKALGRDPTRLVPESGNPKLDLVVDLAAVMDWPLDFVADYLAPRVERAADDDRDSAFDGLAEQSRLAHMRGDYQSAVDYARRASVRAASDEQRAVACVREASAWDGLGKYAEAMEATKRGLGLTDVSRSRRAMLEVNLAIEYYTLWQLVEAEAIAHSLIDRYRSATSASVFERSTLAFSLYVRGNARRRRMRGAAIDAVAREAHQDLLDAVSVYDEVQATITDGRYTGVVNTCRGAILEVESALGIMPYERALEEIREALRSVNDEETCPTGDSLESLGWWCIFGCNIVLRHVDEPKQVQHALADFTKTADKIAGKLNNWALRERVFSIDMERRGHFADWTGMDPPSALSHDDLRVLAGTMGRFPSFHRTGWRLIDSAKVVGGN